MPDPIKLAMQHLRQAQTALSDALGDAERQSDSETALDLDAVQFAVRNALQTLHNISSQPAAS